ncbi:hypothetical protein [Streptomyces griseosporeus]|uniref:hypothetical protein n=1 Tax=Streptomyces griseosporeus TaxID=1910 RepID=UPI0036F68B63
MLQITYHAVADLPPGKLVRIDEDRGVIDVLLDKNAPLGDVLTQLNREMDQFLARADWFQLWGDEIVSRHTPQSPVRLEFTLDPYCAGWGEPAIFEGKGTVHVRVDPELDVERFVAAFNPAVKEFLDGGCWFQLFGSEIIDHSPGPMSQV